MANDKRFKVKNGLETQNISFIDTSDNEITVSITDDRISFSGDSGQLFSITDSLTGTIFAVNDISGVPSIEVDDDGTIRFAEISGNVLIGTTTDDGTNRLQIAGGVSATDLSVTNTITGSIDTADKWTTARTLSLTGAVTGSASIDGSGNVSLATTATSDPTLTLNGDVSGSATFTNLGNATLTVTVADDSHNHIISNVDGLQTALDTKYQSGDSISVANITATGYLRGPATFTIDPAAHGDNTGTVVIAGNLQVDGTTTTINSTTVEVDDLNITLASGAANAAAANGAGITIDGASASLTYNGTSDYFAFNKEVYVATDRVFHDGYHPNADKWTTARTLTLSGDVSGSASIDGSANVTMTTTVANDSHSHSDYVLKAGDTMTGSLNMFERNKITGLSGSIANYPALTFESSEGTHAAKTQTLSGDLIGRIEFNPYTGSSYTSGGRIDFLATESIVSAQRGTEARIYGTKTGESAQSYLQFKDDEVKIKDVAGSFHKVFADNYHPNADKWTTARTITLGGDLSGNVSIDGSSNVTLTATVADDSHNHIISNVDGLQTALDAKQDSSTALTTSTSFGGDVSGTYNAIVVADDSHNHSNYLLNNADDQIDGALTLYKNAASPTLLTLHNYQSDISGAGNNQGNFIDFKMTDDNATYTPQARIGMIVNDYSGDAGIPSEGTGNFVVYTSQGTDGSGNGTLTERFRVTEDGRLLSNTSDRVFTDAYHPNADKWTTARTLSLTGAVTGSASIDGSGNVSLATTATSDPTLTLNGDVSGSATFTNLGNATLTVTVADDSHNHVISNVDGLQTALDGKVDLAGDTMTGNLTIDGAKIILESTLDFVSPDTTNTISLNMLDTDTLSFEGNAGQLFSITDSLSGTIFSVNDISGIPSIEVDDDGTIRLAEFSGNILIGTSTASANPYKLQMEGSMEMRGTSPYIRFTEGTTEKGYVQWSSLGYMQIGNDEDGSRLRLKDDLDFTSDNGSNWNSIWHAGNFSTGSDTRNFGALQIGGTTVIDSSRNLTNIGTISSTGAVDFQVAVGSSNVIVRQTGQAFTSGATSLTGLGIRNTGTSGNYTIFEAQTGAGTAFQVRNNGDVRVLRDLMIGSTTVIDSSRNLTNIGSITGSAAHFTSNYGGGTGDYTNVTTPPLKLETTSGYIRVPHISANEAVSIVYNYETGKDVFWGEPNDTGIYRFRGRDLTIENGVLKIGSNTVIDSSRNLTNIGTISSGAITATSFAVSSDSTITGARLTITDNTDALRLYSTTNGVGVNIKFSDQADGAYAQYGLLTYYHADGVSWGSGNAFVISGSETSLSVAIDGKLITTSGLYIGGSASGAGTQVIDSSRNLTNIGTISSGAITSSSTIRSNSWFQGASGTHALYSDTTYGTILQAPSNTNDAAGSIFMRDGSGVIHFSLNTNTNAASFHGGTISSGAITSTGASTLANGTTIGGVELDSNAIGVSEAGLVFQPNASYRCIHPASLTATPHSSDISLGWSNNKWKDIYLAGYVKADSGYQVGTTTVIDSSRNVSNVNLYRFTQDNFGMYVSPTNTNTLNGMWGEASDNGDLWINYRGYQDGTTYFRDFRIGDGKNKGLVHVDGSAADINIGYDGRAVDLNVVSGNYQVNGTTVIDSSRNLTNIASISSGTVTAGSNSSNFIARTASEPNNYYATFEANYNYSQAFRINVKGGGAVYSIMQFGDAAGLQLHGGANSIIKFSNDNLSDINAITVNDQLIGGIGAGSTGGATDWNDSTNARSGNGFTLLLGSHTNGPGPSGYYFHPFSFEYNSKNGSGNMTQMAVPYLGESFYYRHRYDGTWSNWRRLWDSEHFATGTDTRNFGALQIGGTTVIDSSRNLLNIGRAEVDYVQTNSGIFHRVYESGWAAGAQTHDVFYGGWTGSTSDYIYLKTAGNSTAGHGQLIVADNALFYGRTNAETGGIVDSSTAPFEGSVVAMKVDTNGKMTLGRDGTTPQINLIYDDHASGAGWDTSIHIGLSNNLPNGDGTFPTSTPSGAYGIQFQANSDGAFFGIEQYTTGNYRPIINWGDDTTDTPFRILFNGTGQFIFSYNGNFTAAGNVTAYSDIRLKENIEVIPNALEKVQQIRGVTFTRNDQKDTEKRHAGVIAQEVEKVLPEVVEYNEEEDVKTVSYGNMVGLLIEAIKELKAEVEDLKAQLKEK